MMDKLSRRDLNRIENLVILLLACSALFLISRTGFFQGFFQNDTGQSGTSLTVGAGTTLSRGTPSALAVQTSAGRYGAQYDAVAVETLYEDGLDKFLLDALGAMDRPLTAGETDWRDALTEGENWVYYDFLYDISFAAQTIQGEGQKFLITTRGSQADSIYYYSAETGNWTSARLRDGPQLPELTFTPNQVRFAFEGENDLFPDTLLVPQAPVCPVYTAQLLFGTAENADWEDILRTLDLNPRAATVYEAADAMVIRVGAGTLRIQNDGAILFQRTAEGSEPYFKALSDREKDLQSKAGEILNSITAGQGSLVCRGVDTLADGSIQLTYCDLLSGVPAEDYAARFTFRDSDLSSFELRLYSYTATEELCAVLPQYQASAAAAAMGQSGKELRLYYWQSSDGVFTARWTVRE